MNKWLRFFGAISVLVFAVTLAQAEENNSRRERFRNNMCERIAKKLELDETATAKLKEIMTNQMEARKKLAEELKSETAKLKELVEKEASEKDLNAQIDKVVAKRNEMHNLMNTSGDEIRQLIGTEKYAKWLLMQGKAMQGIKERISGRRNQRSSRGNRDNSGSGNWGYERE